MKKGTQLPNINKILIHRLRKYNFQNFSQILNTPEPEPSYFSYFENITNIIYNTMYNDEPNIETEIDKDLDKFSEENIIISDAFDKIWFKKDKDNNKKTNLKILLEEESDIYINKIDNKYKIFCNNHKEIPKIKNKSNINNKNDELIKNQRFLNLKSIYITNEDILLGIPDEYKVQHNEFKTDPDLLSKPVNYLRVKCDGLIKMSTQIDKELEKILGHTNKLDHYIQNNWQPWNLNINLYFENIKIYHKKIDSIKNKALGNTSKLILKEIKRKNIKKLRDICKQFKTIKESIMTLASLIKNVKQYKLINELIYKNQNYIENIKKIAKGKVGIIDLFEMSLKNFKENNNSHTSSELNKILEEYFQDFVYIDETYLNSFEMFQISEANYKLISSYSYGIKRLLEHLQFKKQRDEIEKIDSLCEYYIQNNLIKSIYNKLRGIFTNTTTDILRKLLDFFKTEIKKKEEENEKENNEQKNDINKNEEKNNDIDIDIKEEQGLLLCLIITKFNFCKNMKEFVDEILKVINNSEDKNVTKIIKADFNTECQEIINKIDYYSNFIIKTQLSECFKDSLMNAPINKFLQNYYLINELIEPIISSDEKNKSMLWEYQNNYIRNWTKIKINKFSESYYKSWDPLPEVPYESQLLLNFYFDLDINNNIIENNNFQKALENFEKIKNDFCNIDDNDEIQKTQFLSVKFKNTKKEFETINIKINKTALDIIETSVEVIKLFCLISPGCYGAMLESFSDILIKHITYQKNEIFNYKNNFTVSQKEVCTTSTIFILVKYIYVYFKDCDFFVKIMKHSDKSAIDNFLSVFKVVNEALDLSKKKIEEIIYNNCIDESLKLLEKIQLPNYNVPDKNSDVPVNEYVYTLISVMKIIYDSMIGSYETEFIVKTFKPAIIKFFDKFEYFIFHGKVIEDEKCLKQFRKDMTFLKKNLNFINVFDISEMKSRIDNINKKVLPEHMLKTKKKADEK
jgi:hypothetical protein